MANKRKRQKDFSPARTVLEEEVRLRDLETEARKAESSDSVHHPRHYNRHPSGVECIDIVEHFTFNIGTVIKHLWRAGLKSPTIDGSKEEDLQKAQWYLGRELERLRKERE